MDLRGIKIAVVGGDKRQLYMIPELVRQGALVTALGLPYIAGLEGVRYTDNLEATVRDTQAIVFSIPGVDAYGKIKTLDKSGEFSFDLDIARQVPPGTIVIVGYAQEFLRQWASQLQWILLEILEMDDFAILNAIPSAEGALQIAMEELPVTLHNSRSFVLGYGRLGKTLARMLQAIGAKTTVVVRKAADMARLFEAGYQTVSFTELPAAISLAEIIFNTVPALVLDKNILSLLKKDALIIDLASAPGGTDFAVARDLGLRAIFAPGLPGKVAPATSGKFLAQTVSRLIIKELTKELREELG